MKINNYNEFKLKFPADSIALATLREQALQKLENEGLHTKKEEAWKYTSLKAYSELDWNFPVNEELLSHDELKNISQGLNSDFYNFVFINGQLNNTLSDEIELWMTISDVDNVATVSERFPVTEQKLTNLFLAGLDKAIILKIAPGVQLNKPVQLTFVQKSVQNLITQPAVQIYLENGASAKIIQNFISFESQKSVQSTNATTQVYLRPNSDLEFVQLQNESAKDYHFSRVQFYLESGAQLNSLDMSLGGTLSRHYLEVMFLGENAFAGVYGLTALSQDQHADQYTFICHSKGLNQSVQHYKSILTDSAESVFRGRVRIEQNAQKANSEQLNNNLLLTRTANATSIPQLEIYADDVKAGHGSTVGQLSADEIFYFLSRGINQTEAVRMLAYGYAIELVHKLRSEILIQHTLKTLNKKLEGMIPNV